jgi:predicted dehydrogenase
MSLSPLTIHSRKYNVETDTTVDLSEMDYLDHTVYADGAHYDNSQQHWVHALLGKCDLLPTAKIALETQRVQEGIYFSERLGREVTADEIEALSESKALEIPNLAL